jgi:hypothetical protein
MTPTEMEPEIVAVDCAKAAPETARTARAVTLIMNLPYKELTYKLSLYGFTAFQNRFRMSASNPEFQCFDTVISNVQNSRLSSHFGLLYECFMNVLC